MKPTPFLKKIAACECVCLCVCEKPKLMGFPPNRRPLKKGIVAFFLYGFKKNEGVGSSLSVTEKNERWVVFFDQNKSFWTHMYKI